MMFMQKLWTGDAQKEAAPAREPVIGLALGGGSARGWAHLGILRKLDEAGIGPRWWSARRSAPSSAAAGRPESWTSSKPSPAA